MNSSAFQTLLKRKDAFTTMFAPTNEAFAKLPPYEQKNLKLDYLLLNKVSHERNTLQTKKDLLK